MILNCSYIYKRFRYVKKRKVSINICEKILSSLLHKIVNDIIENKTYVEIPRFWGSAIIYMRKINGDEFVDRYRNGEFNDVDYLVSNYTGYKISIKNSSFDEINDVTVDCDTKDKITELTNRGYRY